MWGQLGSTAVRVMWCVSGIYVTLDKWLKPAIQLCTTCQKALERITLIKIYRRQRQTSNVQPHRTMCNTSLHYSATLMHYSNVHQCKLRRYITNNMELCCQQCTQLLHQISSSTSYTDNDKFQLNYNLALIALNSVDHSLIIKLPITIRLKNKETMFSYVF